MKKYLSLIIAALFVLILTGCASTTDETKVEEASLNTEELLGNWQVIIEDETEPILTAEVTYSFEENGKFKATLEAINVSTDVMEDGIANGTYSIEDNMITIDLNETTGLSLEELKSTYSDYLYEEVSKIYNSVELTAEVKEDILVISTDDFTYDFNRVD